MGQQISLTRKSHPLEVIVGRLCYSGDKGSGDGFLFPVGTGEFYIIPERRKTPKSYYKYSPYSGNKIPIHDRDRIEVIRSFSRQLSQNYTTINCYGVKYVVSL